MTSLLKLVEEVVDEVLTESRAERVIIDDRELPFGHPDHVEDLERTLVGLERLRDCYAKGSGHRLMYAQACVRLRKLIGDLKEKQAPRPDPVVTADPRGVS